MLTSYDQSQEIAVHTAEVLRNFRRTRDMPSLNNAYAIWLDCVWSHGVCKQIKDHVMQVRPEMEYEIKRNAKPRVDVTARMTGERE